MVTIFPHIQMMIPQNKNVRELVWHLQYVDIAVEGSELYCYNKEGDWNSVVSQASCRMDVTRLEQWTVDALVDHFEEYEYVILWWMICLFLQYTRRRVGD